METKDPFFAKKKSLAILIDELGEKASNKGILDKIFFESKKRGISELCLDNILNLMEREGSLRYDNGIYYLTEISEKYLNR